MKVSTPNLVFIHVGKTGGTSLRRTFEIAYGPGSCSPPFVQSQMSQEEASAYDSFPVISGHVSRIDQLRWFPSRPFITLLRHPVDRGLSFLRYVRSLPPESSTIAADARKMSMIKLIETEEAQINLNNAMVRQLGGHLLDGLPDLQELVGQAKATLREAFWFGLYETYAQDVDRLASKLNLGLETIRLNVTPRRPQLAEEDDVVVKRLTELAKYDLELWCWATSDREGMPKP